MVRDKCQTVARTGKAPDSIQVFPKDGDKTSPNLRTQNKEWGRTMDLDPLILSRMQFAFTISFHILFPAFTIGLANWIMVLEGLWLKSGSDIYRQLSEFWTKIFAISFGMGVVSGIVMSYQFGTNSSRWSDITG